MKVMKVMNRNIRNRTKRGFTLIELMIVVAIVGTLAAIAIPRYQKFARDSHEVAMVVLVKDTVSSLKNWRNKAGAYNATKALTSNLEKVVLPTQYPKSGSSPLYTISNEVEASKFTLIITAVGEQKNQGCGFLVVNQQGIVSSTSKETLRSDAACNGIYK